MNSFLTTCNSSVQSGNGSSSLASESVTPAGSVDVSAASHQDSMVEVARQVCLSSTVHLKDYLPFVTVNVVFFSTLIWLEERTLACKNSGPQPQRLPSIKTFLRIGLWSNPWINWPVKIKN